MTVHACQAKVNVQLQSLERGRKSEADTGEQEEVMSASQKTLNARALFDVLS